MSEIFGKAFSDLPRRRTAPGSEFMNKFEIIKRDFGYPSAEMKHELFLNMNPVGVNPEYFNEDESLVIISKLVISSNLLPTVQCSSNRSTGKIFTLFLTPWWRRF